VGWAAGDYVAWSEAQMAAGTSFIVPSTFAGEPMLRLCIVNPRTTVEDIEQILASLR
jgi:L-2,4-diaminobutyrate decarboxylase